MKGRMRLDGNSYQRRKLRRYLNRLVVPKILNGMSVMEAGHKFNVSTQTIYKHLSDKGIVQSAWMYKKPTLRIAA